MKHFALVGLALSVAVQAEEVKIYQVQRSHVVPGHTSYYVMKGHNIGQMLPIKIPQGEQLMGNDTSFEQKMRIFKEGEAYKQQAVRNHTDAIAKEFKLTPGTIAKPSIAGVLATAEQQALPTLDLKALQECAKRALPVLKKLQTARERGDKEVAAYLESQLVSERADGESASPSGVPCGMHMGKAGLVSHSWSEDVKMLAAFSARESTELSALLEAFALAHKPGLMSDISAAWRYVWQRMAIEAVFTKEALKSHEGYAGELIAKKEIETIAKRITATMRHENVLKSIEQGHEAYRKVMQ